MNLVNNSFYSFKSIAYMGLRCESTVNLCEQNYSHRFTSDLQPIHSATSLQPSNGAGLEKFTAIHSYFDTPNIRSLGMSNLPHFLTDPVDPNGQAFRADCMAWELFTKKPKTEREAFIAGQTALQTGEFRQRLYRCEAWWLLTHLNAHLIEENLAAMPEDQERELRSHLEGMRTEIKRFRQHQHKTLKGSKAYA